MANPGKWKLDTTMKFIHCYKSQECLWNYSSPEYKNKQKRDAAYTAIVNEMNIDNFGIQEVKNKIKNLRSTYKQELKKIEDSKKSGAGPEHVYIPNIRWLKEMDEVFTHELKIEAYEDIPETYLQCEAFTAEEISTTALTPLRAKKRSRKSIKAIKEFKSMHNQVQIRTEEESPFDVFGKSVGMQLKKLSVENALLAQQKIQCILTEIGIIDYREKTGNISTISD